MYFYTIEITQLPRRNPLVVGSLPSIEHDFLRFKYSTAYLSEAEIYPPLEDPACGAGRRFVIPANAGIQKSKLDAPAYKLPGQAYQVRHDI
jgi:hypothetical protein